MLECLFCTPGSDNDQHKMNKILKTEAESSTVVFRLETGYFLLRYNASEAAGGN